MRLKPIADQTIVITGASSGIGLATARAAAEAGARLVLAARNEAALAKITHELELAGGEAIYVVADVAEEADVRAIAERALDRFGGFDTWFNNAGCAIFGSCEQVSLADHRRLFETNYWGVVHGSLAALPHLRRRGGALINMGSMLSDISMPLHGPYNATKHAIKGFTDTLRMELEHERAPVSVTLVKPGAVNTPLQQHAGNYLPTKPMLPPPAYEPRVVAHAVLHAAQRPMRDVVVGEAAQLLRLGNSMAPPLADRLMESTLFRLQQTDQLDYDQQTNLYRPTTGGEERGDHPLVFSDSPYTRLTCSASVSSARELATALASAPLVVVGGLVSSVTGRLLSNRSDHRT